MRLHRLGCVLELELVDACRAQQGQLLDVAIGRPLERPRVGSDHVVPHAGLAGEPLALLERVIPARIFDERFAPPVKRLGLIVELAFSELGESLIHRLAIRAG